jgi:hypothetical protein
MMATIREWVFRLAKDKPVIREASLWDIKHFFEQDVESLFLEEDVRPVLLRMEEDREIERFHGYYRVLAPGDAPA